MKTNWKKILFLVVLVIVSIAIFEFAFLFDFNASEAYETKLAHKFGLSLFILLQVFFYFPCFVLGYGRINALWGFIPPVLLTVIFWILMLRHLTVSTGFSVVSFPFFYHYVIGSCFLSGIFGILVVYLVRKIITRYSKRGKEDSDSEEEDSVSEKKKKESDPNNQENNKGNENQSNVTEPTEKEQDSEISPDNKVSGVSNDGN